MEEKRGEIYQLIGQAMREIGAIGKTTRNEQQGFLYRGIDAVYNALNPVMAKYGLFVCPEILEQKREERHTKSGTVLVYTILTVRYTVFAPDGSCISLTVAGEAMDSGDKSMNKAMSTAMKYAMFQLFMIPTEDLRDPDADCYRDIVPEKQPEKGPEKPPEKPPKKAQEKGPEKAPEKAQGKVQDKTQDKPQEKSQGEAVQVIQSKQQPDPVKAYIEKEMRFMMRVLDIRSEEGMLQAFATMKKSLIDGGVIPDIRSSGQTMEQARDMIDAMYANFMPGARKSA